MRNLVINFSTIGRIGKPFQKLVEEVNQFEKLDCANFSKRFFIRVAFYLVLIVTYYKKI